MSATVPQTARYLTPTDGDVFPPTAPPELRGYCKDADRAFARLWTGEGRLIWVREMTRTAAGSDWFTYQMANGAVSEVKRWHFNADVTGGTVRFRYHDVVTDPIPFTNQAVTFANRVRDAFVKHVDFSDASNLSVVYDTAARDLTITFINGRGWLDINDISVINNLSGGANPTVTGSTVTAGVGDVPQRNAGAGTWRWDMIGYNNTTLRYSGDVGTQRQARSSGMSVFCLDTPPTVAFTTGTGRPQPGSTVTVTVTQVTFEWVVTSLTDIDYQELNLVDDVTGDQIDIVPGAGVAWTTTDGEETTYRLPYQRIANGKTYRWSFRARNSSGQVAFYTGKITVAFTPPATLTGATLVFPPVGNNTYATLTWPKSAEGVNFIDYVVRVREAGVAFASRYNRPILQIKDVDQLSELTFEFPFNTDLIFSVVQRANRAGEAIESAPVEWAVRVPYDGITINKLTYPRNFSEFPAHTGRSIRGRKQNTYLESWFDAKAVGLSKRGAGYEIAFTAKLMGSYPDGAREQWRQVRAFYENEDSDTLLYRDSFGEIFYVLMDEPELGYAGGGQAGTVGIGLTEVRYAAIDLDD